MRFFAKVFAIILWSTLACSAEVDTNYRIEGLAPGEFVVFSSKQYQRYKCGPSDLGDLTWCRKTEKRKFMGQMVDSVTSISHRPDGEVLYISYTLTGVRFQDSLAGEQIGYLRQQFGMAPQTLQLNTQSRLVSEGVIAYWGGIDLQSLRSDERDMIEAGQPTGKGFLVDYLSSPRLSVQERLPVYSISSGYGYIYMISRGPKGKGTISFRALNNRAILAELAVTAGDVLTRNTELQNLFGEAENLAAALPPRSRLAFDQLRLDYQNDRNVSSLHKIEQYKAKLKLISVEMTREIATQAENRAQQDRLQPILVGLKQTNIALLPDNLKLERDAIIVAITELMAAPSLNRNEVDAAETRYRTFLHNKDAFERLAEIKSRVKRSADETERFVDRLDTDADKDAARTLILKAKATGETTPYAELADIDRQFQSYRQKVQDLNEFDDISKRAQTLIDKIDTELKNVIDDGATVQSVRAAIEKTRAAIQSKNLSDLKASVVNLTSLYESSQRELKDKSFDTF